MVVFAVSSYCMVTSKTANQPKPSETFCSHPKPPATIRKSSESIQNHPEATPNHPKLPETT